MKHLSLFENYKDDLGIQDILNIAKDEGLIVDINKIDNRYFIYIERFVNRYDLLDPLCSNEKFISITKDIYRRLDNDGFVNKMNFHPINSNVFLVIDGAHEDFVDIGNIKLTGGDIIYAEIELV